MTKSSFSFEELVACGHGKLFEPGHPRLPVPPMLMFDRVTQITEEGGEFGHGVILAEMDVRPDLWFFDCHFKTDPVMPGCLGVDALWQIAGFFLTWKGFIGKGRALGVERVDFKGQIFPHHKKVDYRVDVKRVFARTAAPVIIANGTVAVDGEVIYRCENLKVGVFQNI